MANIFRANIIDVSRETLTVAIFGDRDKTEALVRLAEGLRRAGDRKNGYHRHRKRA